MSLKTGDRPTGLSKEMNLDLHYVDPRLVALYDLENPRGEDTDFYLQLAAEIDAQTIVDLGCGTGLLTRELAEIGGRTVIGVDPAAEMLAYAKRQPGAEKVNWINGIAADIGPRLGQIGQLEADLALMTGNVAQVFLDDDEWLATLKALHGALKGGGTLAFESRNPLARSWEGWNPETTFFPIEEAHEPVETWLEVVDVQPKTVAFRGYNRFVNSDEIIVVDSTLRFRTKEEITDSLNRAGFSIKEIYSDWQRTPYRDQSHMLLFIGEAG